MTRSHRTYVELPADLVAHLRAHAEFRGVTVSELCFHWVVTAARLAHQGNGRLLPQVGLQGTQRRAERGSRDAVKVVRWLQGQDEWSRCRAEIQAAGSSVGAVLQQAAEEYVAVDGDVLAMTWPPKSALSRVA